MQIYKNILDFKNREPNPFGYKIYYTFRYNSFQPLEGLSSCKPSTLSLYYYILCNLKRRLISDMNKLDLLLEMSMTVNLHPDAVGIKKQHIKTYLDELIALNFIVKAGDRGYEYHVNPYYYNVLSKPLADHCFVMMQQLFQV